MSASAQNSNGQVQIINEQRIFHLSHLHCDIRLIRERARIAHISEWAIVFDLRAVA